MTPVTRQVSFFRNGPRFETAPCTLRRYWSLRSLELLHRAAPLLEPHVDIENTCVQLNGAWRQQGRDRGTTTAEWLVDTLGGASVFCLLVSEIYLYT